MYSVVTIICVDSIYALFVCKKGIHWSINGTGIMGMGWGHFCFFEHFCFFFARSLWFFKKSDEKQRSNKVHPYPCLQKSTSLKKRVIVLSAKLFQGTTRLTKCTHIYRLLTAQKPLPGSDGLSSFLLKAGASTLGFQRELHSFSTPTFLFDSYLNDSRKATVVANDQYPFCQLQVRSWEIQFFSANCNKLHVLVLASTHFFCHSNNLHIGEAFVCTANKLLYARNAGLKTGVVFIDLSKSFDTVRRQQLT